MPSVTTEFFFYRTFSRMSDRLETKAQISNAFSMTYKKQTLHNRKM